MYQALFVLGFENTAENGTKSLPYRVYDLLGEGTDEKYIYT